MVSNCFEMVTGICHIGPRTSLTVALIIEFNIKSIVGVIWDPLDWLSLIIYARNSSCLIIASRIVAFNRYCFEYFYWSTNHRILWTLTQSCDAMFGFNISRVEIFFPSELTCWTPCYFQPFEDPIVDKKSKCTFLTTPFQPFRHTLITQYMIEGWHSHKLKARWPKDHF